MHWQVLLRIFPTPRIIFSHQSTIQLPTRAVENHQGPIDLIAYKIDSMSILQEEHLQFKTPFFSDLSSKWSNGLRNLFKELPKFEWEDEL